MSNCMVQQMAQAVRVWSGHIGMYPFGPDRRRTVWYTHMVRNIHTMNQFFWNDGMSSVIILNGINQRWIAMILTVESPRSSYDWITMIFIVESPWSSQLNHNDPHSWITMILTTESPWPSLLNHHNPHSTFLFCLLHLEFRIALNSAKETKITTVAYML